MNRGVTGKYKGCKYWDAVIEAAAKRPHLENVLSKYKETGHPACLNVIMDNADANLWLTYYSGRITNPS